MSEVFPKQITETVADLYWDALQNKPIGSVGRAFRYLAREHPKNVFPTPFEIRQACSDSFAPVPENRRLTESAITPKERRWNKMILGMTLKAIQEKRQVTVDDIILHAESVGFDKEFIGIQMAYFDKAQRDVTLDVEDRVITENALFNLKRGLRQ